MELSYKNASIKFYTNICCGSTQMNCWCLEEIKACLADLNCKTFKHVRTLGIARGIRFDKADNPESDCEDEGAHWQHKVDWQLLQGGVQVLLAYPLFNPCTNQIVGKNLRIVAQWWTSSDGHLLRLRLHFGVFQPSVVSSFTMQCLKISKCW